MCPDNPELDYEALAISNGGMAMNAFKEMRDNPSKEIITRLELSYLNTAVLIHMRCMRFLINYYQLLILKFSISSSSGSKLTVIRDSSL